MHCGAPVSGSDSLEKRRRWKSNAVLVAAVIGFGATFLILLKSVQGPAPSPIVAASPEIPATANIEFPEVVEIPPEIMVPRKSRDPRKTNSQKKIAFLEERLRRLQDDLNDANQRADLAAQAFPEQQAARQVSRPTQARPAIQPTAVITEIAQLEGFSIVASDGQYLGKITGNQFDANSIVNQFGQYGNQFNPNSMLNEFGKYGNPFSPLSPFNELALNPPVIVSPNGQFVAFLSVNRFKTPGVNPHSLLAVFRGR
jgi:hypothetical protein